MCFYKLKNHVDSNSIIYISIGFGIIYLALFVLCLTIGTISASIFMGGGAIILLWIGISELVAKINRRRK
jgi:hypothetical protein